MKVAINRCFGGFGLSDKAFEMLLTKKGIAFESRDSGSSFLGTEYYTAGHLGDNDFYLAKHEHYSDRADRHLIEVLEELGEEADDWASDIVIVEVPDEVQWFISEWDGMEHVAECHRKWYGD